jgi:SAM-dependent methyltransferase
MSETREAVRDRYARLADQIKVTGESGCCGGPDDESCSCFVSGYSGEEIGALGLSTGVSLGCGNPTALADLQPGEKVLDLGSGGGLDVLLSARRVAPHGHAYGVDMTDEMLAVSEANRARAGVANATFLKGAIEHVPLPDAAVDVVISNCVVNLAEDKGAVLREAARVLRPGGRLAVADMVAIEELDAEARRNVDLWAGCISGSIPVEEYRGLLQEAGFTAISIDVHDVLEAPGGGRIGSAYIRAVRP